MSLLKKIPICYLGELHDVRLVNFSAAMEEVIDQVPVPIKVRNFGGRALFSMVDVKLKKMRPSFSPDFIHFDYRHIAFRLLVDDSKYNQGAYKGLYFFRSFSDRLLIVVGGALLTNYQLQLAHIEERENKLSVVDGEKFITYRITDIIQERENANASLKKNVEALDRAYSLSGSCLQVTQIQREKWPIKQVQCTEFETNFFETARLEGAFRVFETIHYEWLPAKPVSL